jgi:methyl-accepting chemotaxis protein
MFRLTIFPKMLLVCLLIAAVPVSGLYFSIKNTQSETALAASNSLQQSGQLVALEVNNWVDKNIQNAEFLTNLKAFKEMDAEKQVPLLSTAKNNLDWVSLIFTADTQGNAVARSDGKPLKNYSDREYFQSVINEGQELGQQVLIGKVKPIPLHCFALPIENNEIQTELSGVITQCSSLVAISKFVSDTRVGKTGFAILLDNKNRLISHGRDQEKLYEKLEDFSDHIALSIDNDKVTTLTEGTNTHAFYKTSVGPGWTLILQQDHDEAYSRYFSAKTLAKNLSLATLASTLLLTFVVSYSISKPVKRLTEIANAASKGKALSIIPGTDRSDELGDLARAVSRMTKTISIALGRLKQDGS